MKKLLAKIRKLLRDRRTRQIITRFVSVTAAIVVFVTTYALVLPAITMESEAYCGIPAHQHSDDCYELQLTCEIPESPGHQHTDACYTVNQVLTCETEEHQHGDDCYDEEGNLTCTKAEHTHSADDNCYEEERVLICEEEESEGHQHTDECYEKVLTCGLEVHTHSTECYANPDSGTTNEAAVEVSSGGASTGAAASSTGVSSTGATEDDAVEYDFEDGNEAAGTGSTEATENASTALTTVENAAAGVTADGSYIPQLEQVDFTRVLDNHTGIYYHAVADGETVEDSTALTYDQWNRVDKDTELGVNDLLRVYLAYTVPAGSLNPTNQVARYRLPGNLHLTEAQIKAINENVNGIAGQYVNMSTLEILDIEKYYAYLGIEAVEGTRRPDEDVNEYLADLERSGKDAVEYISAIVRVENMYDEQSGEYEGQDLVFTWTPYSIEKNQHEYDSTGQSTKAGEEIQGWLTLDFNLSQVDWDETSVDTFERETEVEAETAVDAEAGVDETAVEDNRMENDDADTFTEDNSDDQAVDETGSTAATVETVERTEKTADIVFVAEGRDEQNNKIHEISTKLTVVEETVVDVHTEDDRDAENAGEGTTEDQGDIVSGGEATDAVAATTEEPAVEDQEQASESTTVDTSEQLSESEQYSDGTLTAEGDGYKITLDYTAEAEIPENAELKVTEITAESDPEAYEACLEQAAVSVSKNGSSATVDTAASRFFDIEIQLTTIGDDGQENVEKIEPAAPVAVNIQLDATSSSAAGDENNTGSNADTKNTASNEQAASDPTILHFAEDGVEKIESTTVEAGAASATADENGATADRALDETAQTTEIQFEAESFSIYGVVYTVDFHWEVNGKMYDFSMPGGGFVSFYNLIEVLGILDGTNNTDIDEFLADVENVEFSDPSLVSVSKVEENTTVGAIKDDFGLECEYSAELTEEQIAEINAQTVDAGDWALISMLPFESTESLTVTMKTGEVFEIRVTDYQLKKTVIDAKGDTWEITVTYDDSAEIPEGAELSVEEILPEDEKYEQYYQQSLEKIGVVAVPENTEESDPELTDEASETASEEASGYAHIFDIQIWAGDQQIEPASGSAVAVSIKLLDAPEDEDTNLQVVHFGKDGLEVMELTENEEESEEKAGETELNFVTDEFSVYSVVEVTNDNMATVLNNGPYALVTGIADDNGTTGWTETWGTDYFTIIVNAQAMTDTAYNNGLATSNVHAWTDGDQGYVGGSDAEIWYFESAGNNQYYIYVLKDGVKNYINQWYYDNAVHDQIGLSTQYPTAFTITPNSDGTVLIHSGNWYLHNTGSDGRTDEWAGRKYTVSEGGNTNDESYRFRLCKESDGFEPKSAQKVSASTITTNTDYVIYRKFEDAQGNETLYALAHDGTFVRVYDGGDTIYYRETDKNIFWNYQMDGNYPVLFTQDPTTHETIYINPNHSTGQTLSTTAGGLTLIGKDNGEYSTAIERWDQTAYDYAGLHVTQNNDGTASLSTGTRVAGTSDEFLFAVASAYPGATAETVATVDSDSLGIKITMFDYGEWDNAYSAGTKLDDMTAIAGSAEYTPHAAHALVKPYLESGLPSGTAGAMTGLFSSGGAIKSSKENVNHLFLQSYYDESGTFRYRSEDNYAYLPFSDGQITGTDFIVYRQAATPYTTDYAPGHTYYNHGHFMPYNDIDMNNNLSRLMNQYGNEYTNGTAVGEIPLEDGRTYEDIYGVVGTPNFYTGMKMEANFSQPRDGKLENGDEMIFKFTGDDDMWVYIDGILVLDIGGIHEPLSGTINFATGKVTNPTGSSLAGTKTLYEIFQNVLTASGTPQDVKDKINSITWKDVDGDGTPDTFADYTNHSFSAFYMERGAGASNLDIQFNLKVVLTNQFVVEKEIPEDVDDRFDNQVYRFRATYMDSNNQEQPLHAGIANVCSSVVYRDKYSTEIVNGKEVKVPVPVSVDDDGYFTLRAGEAAIFMMADESIKYNVKEVDLDQYNLEKIKINGDEVTEHVEINDQQATIIDNAAVAGYDEVGDRSNVLYTNYPKTQDLLITKHISADSAPMVAGENPVFEFRVYLETTETNTDGTTQRKLVPYSYGPYYLTKEVEGETHYFTLTGVNNAPVDKGTTKTVCSTTGRSGSINSIPPEYTIVIPKLVVGTNFYVEERFDNIPEGYEFVSEDLKEGTYDENNLGTTAEIIDHVLPRDQSDHQEFDPETVGRIKQDVDAECHVYNRKPAVIITVEKEWDPEPEDGTTVTVELHRYAKITKGTISVTLYDNNEAPIEGAVFELYKDRVATGTEVTTNVNGIASISGLEVGTYKLVQKSTPAGYSMEGHTTETGTLTVADNVTTPQTLSESLTNTALVTAGKVTLTLTDSGAGSGTEGTPIAGATYSLYKDGSAFKTGLATNSEGKVIVGNLDAGEYYLVQMATTADYNLPNVTRTASFTVVENPGVTQEFNQSMTNSLKGKGTVSLTLVKESGEAISGASFQLKSGNTVLETASTGSDGTLSFSTELYEGTYTVHQVNTGDAGDEYATAADKTVTIQANSLTNQHQSLTFTNEEASIIYKLTIRSSSDNLSVSYNYKKGTVVTLTFDNGNEWYDPYDGIVLSGDVTGTISGHSSSFTVTMNGDKTITLTSTGNSNWSNVVTNALQVSPAPETGTKASVSMARSASINSTSGLRALSTPKLMTASGTTRSITHTNASPATAPEGYAEDSTFEAIEITLPTADGWRYTFDAQDKFDANGDPYYYYIVETACSDSDYWIDSYTGGEGGLLNDAGTLKVKNVKEKTGSIQVTKTFSGVEELPAGFQITNSYNSEVFKVANASGTGTTEDPYVWTLSGIPADTTVTFTESGATINGYNLTVTSSGTVEANSQVSATVAAGSTVTASLVNTYEPKTTSVTLKKVDKDDVNEDDPDLLKGASFTLSKYESDNYQSKDLNWGTQGSVTISDDKKPDGTYTLNGVFTFEGLSVGYYKIEEINFPAGYVKLSSDPTFKIEANASNELTITLLNNPDNLLRLVDGELSIIVGNTPGAALPNTGGPGTRFFVILGSILVMFAGAMLWRRRKCC